MDFTQKLAVMQLMLPSTRNELDFPSEWYLAENRRFLDLEFFNRIGRFPLYAVSGVVGPVSASKQLFTMRDFKRNE
jgi:hypothetical protein